MMNSKGNRRRLRFAFATTLTAACLGGVISAPAQNPDPDTDPAALLQRIDAASETRYDHVLGFTETEHYSVFRGKDETHPAAEMTVKVTYRRDVGKTYEIVSQSGSDVIQKFGLEPLLDSEKAISDPAVVKNSWFTTANYEMRVDPGKTRQMDGRTCVAVSIAPRRKATNMLDGAIWVDPRDGTIAEVDGIASKSPNVFAGPTHMMRRYTNFSGYAMATHARAESDSILFGHTVVTIDYSGYQLQLRPADTEK